MEFERFRDLAESHGGDLRRWPEAERAAARRVIAEDPRAAGVLADAAALDGLLDDWRVAPASPALRERVRRSAPGGAGLRRSLDAVRLWLAGAGLAAGLAGVSCGVILSTVAVREARDEAIVAAAFHDNSTAIAPFSEPVRSL